LQYYLRAEGLALSWVGTGRFIFSLNLSDADFSAIADRFVAAARTMKRDGWWSGPRLTDAEIRRQVLGEMLRSLIAEVAQSGWPGAEGKRRPAALTPIDATDADR